MTDKNKMQRVETHVDKAGSGLGKTGRDAVTRRSRRGRPATQETIQPLTATVVFKSILQWWKVATPIAVVLAVISTAIVWVQFEPVYRASAWIQIEDRAPFIAYQSREKSKRYSQTQMQLLRSPLVLGPVVSQPEIASLPEVRKNGEPISWLAGKIQARSVGNSEIFEVSFDGMDPENAALLVNAVVDEYFHLRTQNDAHRAQRVIELLEQEKDRRVRDVDDRRSKVRELSKKILGIDPFTGTATSEVVLMNHPLEGIRQRLTNTEVERQILEAQVKAIEESMTNNHAEIEDVVVDMSIRETSEIQDLTARLMTSRAKLQQIETSSAHGKQDAAYIRLAREVKMLEETLVTTEKSIRPRVEREIQAMAVNQRRGELAQMRSQLEGQRLMENLLRERYEERLRDASANGNESLNLEFARAELLREEGVHELIAQRVLQLRTEVGAPSRVTLLNRAVAPGAPVERVPMKMLALAVLASFCFPFGIAVTWERTIRRIGNSRQLEQHSELAVVAEIARLPLDPRVDAQDPTGASGRALSVFEESIDSLRTCLALAEGQQDLQVLAVASAIPGEGKTSVASQLAVSIARSTGGPTLLIDGDMRSPDIHRIFRIPSEPGLAKVLDGEVTLTDAIVTDWSDHVHLLPSGKLHKNPHTLLGNGAFKALLDEARNTYQYIIIDIPPVLSAAESLVVAKEADGTLICAMQDYSRGGQVHLAYERLVCAGARPVGAVLNGVSARKYTFTYGSYAYARS